MGNIEGLQKQRGETPCIFKNKITKCSGAQEGEQIQCFALGFNNWAKVTDENGE